MYFLHDTHCIFRRCIFFCRMHNFLYDTVRWIAVMFVNYRTLYNASHQCINCVMMITHHFHICRMAHLYFVGTSVICVTPIYESSVHFHTRLAGWLWVFICALQFRSGLAFPSGFWSSLVKAVPPKKKKLKLFHLLKNNKLILKNIARGTTDPGYSI